MEFAGEFETHVTLQAEEGRRIELLQDWAGRHSLKCTHNILDAGLTPSQPMLTYWGHGTLNAQLTAAAGLGRQLAVEGFAVARVKVEVAPSTPGVPASDADAVAGSPWGDHLVLRGSRLLQVWLGDQAREPGDLDWVTRSPQALRTDPWAIDLLAELAQAVADLSPPPGLVFLPDSFAQDDIWTYERADGRRFGFPGRAPGLPGGTVQMDVVFGEVFAEEPVCQLIPTLGGDPALVWVATPGQSLAWKLLWLETDSYPQGKDLYDAALLAGQVFLPRNALADVHPDRHWDRLPATAAEFVEGWRVDWENFQQECPWVTGDGLQWRERLARALAPTFAGCGQPARSQVLVPTWKSADVLRIASSLAAERAFDQLPILADALEDAGCDATDLLAHCRGGLPHAADCWVVTWLLA